MTIDMLVQLEFPFTKIGFAQERAIYQELFLREKYSQFLFNSHKTLTFDIYVITECTAHMNRFREVYTTMPDTLL